MDPIAELLAREDVVPQGPPSETAIAELIARFGHTPPEPLLRLWRAADGFSIEKLYAHIPGPTELLRTFFSPESCREWGDWLVGNGFIPVLDDHQSNPTAVCLFPPLASRVLHLPHDGFQRILYRDLPRFAEVLLEMLDSDDEDMTPDLFLFETPGDFAPDAPRSNEDRRAGRALLEREGEMPGGAFGPWNWAVQLLDAPDLDAWAMLLETNHFVRRDAKERMQGMRDPGVRALLKRDQMEFEKYVREIATAAREAGIFGDLGGIGYTVDRFFHRRKDPDTLERILSVLRKSR